VANTLTFLGYQPVWQDVFSTETGDLRVLLGQQIDHCKGVVQLVGQCYGAEPPTADEEFGRISYTQYEALYARKRGKKVWYLFIDERKLREKVLGPEHLDTLRSRNSLAAELNDQGRFSEAEAQYREIIKVREKVLGPEHPDTLFTRNNLAGVLDDQGKYSEAEAQDRELIKIEERVMGPEHPDTLWSRNNLTVALNDQGKYAEAEAEGRALIEIQGRVVGPEHPDTLLSRATLARALYGQGKYAEAETGFAR
jgi:tetratricopeptide (TPR) repeat protein